MATLNSIDLGDIQSEEQTKDAGLFQQMLPRQDSNNAILLDIFGASRSIIITGILTGTETEQRTFITAIELLNNGQQSSKPFVSSLITSPASRNVFVQSFRWIKNLADIGKINYTLTMVEGAASA